jgi:hypothetical protein
MKYRIFIIVAAIFLSTAVSGQGRTAREQTIIDVFGRLNLTEQPYENLTSWTDGTVFYRPFFSNPFNLGSEYRADGDTIFLGGGTTHEGGYLIGVLLAADGKMTIAETDYRFNRDDRAEYRIMGNASLLIFSDARTGVVKDVLKKMDKNLYDTYTSNFRRYLLAGRYTRAGGGNVVFPPDKEVVTGFKSTGETPYVFAEEFDDTPVPILVFTENEVYSVTKNLAGLELTPMKPDTDYDSGWAKDSAKPVVKLEKTAEVQSGLPPGRFPLASAQVMTLVELKHYAGSPAIQNLKWMRNEIFARYGYKFKTKDMADYFAKMDWYKPQYDDVTLQLTETERINIALIQILEKEM